MSWTVICTMWCFLHCYFQCFVICYYCLHCTNPNYPPRRAECLNSHSDCSWFFPLLNALKHSLTFRKKFIIWIASIKTFSASLLMISEVLSLICQNKIPLAWLNITYKWTECLMCHNFYHFINTFWWLIFCLLSPMLIHQGHFLA